MNTKLKTFTLSNERQSNKVTITNYGARIVNWLTTVDGQQRNIVLGYPNIEDYLTDESYLGAIAGPYANRIANAQFAINDKLYLLDNNEGDNQLHGGTGGLSDLFWCLDYHQQNKLSLSTTIADGYNGYPGDISFNVLYSLIADDANGCELQIKLTIHANKTSVVGPTSHPYFNLAGIANSTANHALKLSAEHYTPVDSNAIPTGEIAKVKDSRFDFTSLTPLAEDNPLDHNFIVKTELDLKTVTEQAQLISPDGKLQLTVKSNYPAIQVYTGEHLATPFTPRDGICLEPQFCPDSPNKPHFPFEYLLGGQAMQNTIVYSVKSK